MVIGGISDGSRLEENLVAAYLADEYSYWYRDHRRHKLYLFLFAIFCLYPHACHLVFSRWLLQLQESFQCLKQEEVVKRGWYHVFSSENAKKKKKDLLRSFSEDFLLHLFDQGNWVSWHPLVMRDVVDVGTVLPQQKLGRRGRWCVYASTRAITMGKVPFSKIRRKIVDTMMKPNSSGTN